MWRGYSESEGRGRGEGRGKRAVINLSCPVQEITEHFRKVIIMGALAECDVRVRSKNHGISFDFGVRTRVRGKGMCGTSGLWINKYRLFFYKW